MQEKVTRSRGGKLKDSLSKNALSKVHEDFNEHREMFSHTLTQPGDNHYKQYVS